MLYFFSVIYIYVIYIRDIKLNVPRTNEIRKFSKNNESQAREGHLNFKATANHLNYDCE